MRNIAILNDLHLGVQRSGGTTIASAAALKQWAHDQYRDLLHKAGNSHTIVNGDLTNEFDVSLNDALAIYLTTRDHLDKFGAAVVTWLLGNHDLSKDSSKLGTVAFLGRLLESEFRERFAIQFEPGFVEDGVYAIPHLVNQDAFDAALAAVPEGTEYLLLHCNFDNTFAVQMDHSLNVERSVVKGFRDRGITTIIAHEHLGREQFAGKLIVVGNQFPTSISDCLGGGDTLAHKRMLRITDAGVESVTTWTPSGTYGYRDVDWQTLSTDFGPDQAFFRVSGTATAEQAAEVIRAISALRQRSQAFVITNAVKIAQIGGMDTLCESVEDVRTVDVVEMVIETLTEPQQAAVRKLREPKEEANV